jgi:hypothetical protein
MRNFSEIVRASCAVIICILLVKDMLSSNMSFDELKLMATLLVTFVFFGEKE